MLTALYIVFPGLHLVLLDRDCVPVTSKLIYGEKHNMHKPNGLSAEVGVDVHRITGLLGIGETEV